MRRFETTSGKGWDAVVGRASWGVCHLLFVPVDEGPVRQIPLEVSSAQEAERSLAGMDQGQLEKLLDRSRIRDV